MIRQGVDITGQADDHLQGMARRKVADAYERGWDEALDAAREITRGAADIGEVRDRLAALAAGPGRHQTGTEPGA